MNFYFTNGHAYAAMSHLIADLKEAERLELNARRFLNELRMAYRPCEN